MKNIDIPPVWLILFMGVAWWQSRYATFGLSLGGPWSDFLGGIFLGAGLLLTLLALKEFRRHRTTVHPHHESDALITSGIYKRTRNPIYLADACFLAGVILYWDAVLSLPLVPIFIWWMERRFIFPEENRLRRKFRMEFARYEQKVRRWI